MLPSSLLMIHNARTSRQHDVPKLTAGQQLDDPLLEVAQLHVVARANDADFVQAAVELDHNLAVAVVVYFFEFANVACVVLACPFGKNR